MSDLVVAGFTDEHTACLASAALTRLQAELTIDPYDIAVVSRTASGEVTVREAVSLGTDDAVEAAFWKTLARLIFSSRGADGSVPAPLSERLTAMGINDATQARLEATVSAGASAVFVLTHTAARDRLQGILRGFRADVTNIPLTRGDRAAWRAQLQGMAARGRRTEQAGTP